MLFRNAESSGLLPGGEEDRFVRVESRHRVVDPSGDEGGQEVDHAAVVAHPLAVAFQHQDISQVTQPADLRVFP